MRRGFTLIEILITLAILGLLVGSVVSIYGQYNFVQALDKDTALVTSLLNQARVLTLTSKGNTQHGLYLESNSVTLFTGSSYVAGTSTNVIFPLNGSVSLSSTINGGGHSIVFERLNGKTFQNGTITLSSIPHPSSTKSITIYGSGSVQSN